jgi:molybdopterin synthase catalytic subunit
MKKTGMIEITDEPISIENIVASAKSDGSGCVVTYVGLIRDSSEGKAVRSVEYRDSKEDAKQALQGIAEEAGKRWPLENIAIAHRIGKLRVGEINLVIAVASAHRGEGFAACQYIIDQFKHKLPTQKTESYL